MDNFVKSLAQNIIDVINAVFGSGIITYIILLVLIGVSTIITYVELKKPSGQRNTRVLAGYLLGLTVSVFVIFVFFNLEQTGILPTTSSNSDNSGNYISGITIIGTIGAIAGFFIPLVLTHKKSSQLLVVFLVVVLTSISPTLCFIMSISSSDIKMYITSFLFSIVIGYLLFATIHK